ncbi:hypothetical protein V6Z11_A05G072700 [Gossypium hirsutum]
MVKAYAQEHIYKHPWERVTSASWRKFADPENKRTLSHILEVDTLNRKLDPLSGWTICRQETSIRIKPLSTLASMAEKVEQRCAERFMQNSVKGREVMERICKYLEAESSGMTL